MVKSAARSVIIGRILAYLGEGSHGRDDASGLDADGRNLLPGRGGAARGTLPIRAAAVGEEPRRGASQDRLVVSTARGALALGTVRAGQAGACGAGAAARGRCVGGELATARPAGSAGSAAGHSRGDLSG